MLTLLAAYVVWPCSLAMLNRLAGSPGYVVCLEFWLSWLAGYVGYTD
jgi:hypothetical protein